MKRLMEFSSKHHWKKRQEVNWCICFYILYFIFIRYPSKNLTYYNKRFYLLFLPWRRLFYCNVEFILIKWKLVFNKHLHSFRMSLNQIALIQNWWRYLVSNLIYDSLKFIDKWIKYWNKARPCSITERRKKNQNQKNTNYYHYAILLNQTTCKKEKSTYFYWKKKSFAIFILTESLLLYIE